MASPALAQLLSHMKRIDSAVSPSVVALKTFFSAPRNARAQHLKFSGSGTGVFVDRGLIVTSAHVVGKVSDEPRGCFIGRNFAVTAGNKVLSAKPLAVSFAGDVAVLEAVAEAEEDLPPPCAVSRSVPSKELPLMVMSRHEDCIDGGRIQLKVRAVEDNSGRTDWPYKLEDGFGWVRYGGLPLEEFKIFPGSPWFSPEAEVAGIASTAVGNEVAGSVGGFVVPPLRIRSVLDYATRKAPHDPIVLDPWISSTTFSDVDANLDEDLIADPIELRRPVYYNRSCHPNVYYKSALLRDVEAALERAGGDDLIGRFKQGPFGRFLEWRLGQSYAQSLHCIVCRALKIDGVKQCELVVE